MWSKALEKSTPEMWNAKTNHTEKDILEWYKRERIIEDTPEIVINIGSCDSDSDTDVTSSE